MAIKSKALLIKLCFITLSCSSPSPWILSSIASGDILFDSSRLRFASTEAHPPFTFEMMKFADRIDSFISLNRFRFTTNPVQVTLRIGGETFEDMAPVYEGGMRLRLSEESTKRVIQALQDGLEVGILVDGFEEKLTPSQFPIF